MDARSGEPRRATDKSIADTLVILRAAVDEHERWLQQLGVPDMSTRQRGLLPVLLQQTEIKVDHQVDVSKSSQRRIALIVAVVGGLPQVYNIVAAVFHWPHL